MAIDLNKLKSIFFVSDEEVEEITKKNEEVVKDKVEPKKPELKKTTTQYSQKTTKINKPKVENSKGEFNQKIFDSLTKAIYDANLPGDDYLEFIEALQAMKNIPLEETIKMQTVLATLSTKGLTKEKVIETADYYLKILTNEKDKFNEALKKQTDGQVNKKKKSIENIEKQIKDKANKIAQLTHEINESKQEIQNIKNDINTSMSKISKTESSFKTTFMVVANQIVSKIEKLKSIP